MNGLWGSQRNLCSFRGCDRFPTETVYLHDGSVPTIVGTCLAHECGLIASDGCEVEGCERRAVRFRRCDVHPKPIEVRTFLGSANRRVTVHGGGEEDDVAKNRATDESDEELAKKVLAIVKENGSIRFGDVSLELGTKNLKRISAALQTLKSRGDVVQIGVPKTPTSRWAVAGYVPPPSAVAATSTPASEGAKPKADRKTPGKSVV